MKIRHFDVAGETELSYILAFPENFTVGTELPLLVYLHGAGERGKKLEHLYRHAIPRMMKQGREIEAIVLCPQCPRMFVWNNVVDKVKALIDSVAKEYGVKPDRICITGSSMGGYGTWEMGLTYRNFFSAIAPVAGGGMSWRAKVLRTTPVYAYHGEDDGSVPLSCSAEMVDAVNNGGGHAELVSLKGFGHNDGINHVYENTDLIQKLLSSRRTDFTYVADSCEEYF